MCPFACWCVVNEHVLGVTFYVLVCFEMNEHASRPHHGGITPQERQGIRVSCAITSQHATPAGDAQVTAEVPGGVLLSIGTNPL